MFEVDVELMNKEKKVSNFHLPCDIENQYQRVVYTNNGRTATTYAFLHGIHLSEEESILIPEYCCISIINALEYINAQFQVYKIKENLEIDMMDITSKITEQTKVLYIIHYFGIPHCKETVARIKELANNHKLVIVEDLTQTLLSKGSERIGFGDYLVASTRKWYPMTDGGIVVAKNGVEFEIVDLDTGYDEAVYKQGLLSAAKIYLENKLEIYIELEKEANKARYLDFTPKAMTEASRNIFYQSNHEESARKRRENYTYLHHHLSGIEGLTIWGRTLDQEGEQVPFGFMVLVEDREEFYQYLAQQGILGEIQWILPTDYFMPSPYATMLSEHSLMLQCDQRYGLEEMEYTCKVIREYF